MRTQISLEKFRLDEISLAEAESAAAMIQADTIEEHMYISAKLQEQEMVCDAMATKHEASAEKEASRSLQAKRKHELELKEKAILEQLGKQGNFNLVGTTGDWSVLLRARDCLCRTCRYHCVSVQWFFFLSLFRSVEPASEHFLPSRFIILPVGGA